MLLQDFVSKFIEPTDTDEPVEGRSMSILDYLIKGFILIFPLVFFREMIFPGFTEQDVYFCGFAVVFTLVADIVTWRSGIGEVKTIPYTILSLSVWCVVCITMCILQILQRDEMAYRFAYYAAGLMLVIALRATGLRGRRYLKLFIVPLCIIYGFLIYFSLSGAETIFGIEALIKAPAELIPFLLLGSVTASILFITAVGIVWRILYGLIYIAGASLMVMYGDVLSWCLLGTGTLAVLLFMLLLPAYSKGRRVIKLLIILSGLIIAGLLTMVVFIQTGSGEWWYPVQRYGARGLYVLSAAAVSFFIMMRADRAVLRDAEIPWVIIAAIYLIQAFYYPLSVSSMPIWLIYLAGAIPAPAAAYASAAMVPSAAATDISGVRSGDGAVQRGLSDDDDELEFLDLDDIDYEPFEDEPDTGGRHDARDKRAKRATVVRARRRLKTDRMKEVTLHVGLGVVACACGAMLASLIMISIRGRGMSADELNGSLAESEAVMIQAEADGELMTGEDVTANETVETGDDSGMADAESDGVIDVADMANYDPNDLGVDISGIDLSALGVDMGDAGDDTGDSDAVDTNSNVSISNGDYTIYDPNATYKKSNDIVAPASGSTRLRSEPSIGDEGVVVHVLGPNERVVRDGIGDNGWSRVKYRGRTCYAVTEYLSVQGIYHGDPSELIVETETPDDADQNSADDGGQTAESQAADASVQSQSQSQNAAASGSGKGKSSPAGYSMQWSADNKTCTIWSSGVKQGTMSVTDGAAAQKINVYSDYYTGSGKNTHKYLSISVPAGENPVSLNADSGFMSALKNMGYSGVYFNKQVIDW